MRMQSLQHALLAAPGLAIEYICRRARNAQGRLLVVGYWVDGRGVVEENCCQ